jgi:hypothetical protein
LQYPILETLREGDQNIAPRYLLHGTSSGGRALAASIADWVLLAFLQRTSRKAFSMRLACAALYAHGVVFMDNVPEPGRFNTLPVHLSTFMIWQCLIYATVPVTDEVHRFIVVVLS